MRKSVLVSVIVPCRNEKKHIEGFVRSVLLQELDKEQIEIIIADGMSDDGTREILNRLTLTDGRLRLIDNPERTTSFALNRAIEAAEGEIVVRMDVHTEYAPDYIRQCLFALEKTGADNVGGPARTKSSGYLQEAIGLAYHSPFGVGGAKFHDVNFEGFVDTVTYGCWKKSTLLRLGLFDRELIRNQDDELNLRLIRSGGKIWQTPKIRSWYHPRASLRMIFRQYMQYGYWKVRVIQKHKLPASIRHIVPGSFVGCLGLLGVLSFFSSFAKLAFLALAGLYFLAALAASVITCSAPVRFQFLPIMPIVFGAYHFGYGFGFLRGAIDFVLLGKKGNGQFSELTRG